MGASAGGPDGYIQSVGYWLGSTAGPPTNGLAERGCAMENWALRRGLVAKAWAGKDGAARLGRKLGCKAWAADDGKIYPYLWNRRLFQHAR